MKEIGLPESDVPTALLFNLGVEAGQLMIVATSLATLAVVDCIAAKQRTLFVGVATYAIGVTVGYWFIEGTIA